MDDGTEVAGTTESLDLPDAPLPSDLAFTFIQYWPESNETQIAPGLSDGAGMPLLLSEYFVRSGSAVDVAVDSTSAIAVVVGSGGVHLVDVSNATAPRMLNVVSIPGGASRVQILDGTAYVAAPNRLLAVDPLTAEVLDELPLGPGGVVDFAFQFNVRPASNVRALSGTPAVGRAPSANPNQLIPLQIQGITLDPIERCRRVRRCCRRSYARHL